MTLQEWADNGWLRAHQTSSQEMANLLDIVDRDLVDACAGISADWRFGIAYNAAQRSALFFCMPQATAQKEHFNTTAQSKPCRLF